MKKILVIAVMLLSSQLFAQSDFYDGTEGLSGAKLKSKLHHLLQNHKRFSYSQIWDILKETDQDTTDEKNVILIHTGWKQNGPNEYAGGQGWNREHVWAKSHGFPSSGDTAYSDAHNLRPSDVSTNSARGNKDYDYSDNPYVDKSGFMQNGGQTGCRTDSDSWETRDAAKGDIARIMFYMSVRYESSSRDLELVDYTNTSGSKFGKLSTLLEWHRNDPPDDFERRRNDRIYSWQKNRNPFTDHPEFVEKIFNANGFFIEKAEAVSDSTIVITFNDDVDMESADNLENYSIDRHIGTPKAVVSQLGGFKNLVLLTFEKKLALNTKYNVKVTGIKSASSKQVTDNSLALLTTDYFVVDVEDEEGLPEGYALAQNYPNPFNPTTQISFTLPQKGLVTLKVYDLLGREVADLINREMRSGAHTVEFNASNLSTGVYFYTIQAGNFTQTKKMMLIK